MRRFQLLHGGFAVLAVLLSDVMCARVAYTYAGLRWCGQMGGCSAPASVAFLLVIPYAAAIALCALLSYVFYRRGKRAASL